jgi:hypothetical protein
VPPGRELIAFAVSMISRSDLGFRDRNGYGAGMELIKDGTSSQIGWARLANLAAADRSRPAKAA